MLNPLYCDHSATCPLRPAAARSMSQWLGVPANPASQHAWGARAAEALERARGQVASLICASPREMVFTGGATEANNLALAAVKAARPDVVMMCSVVEHPAVLEVVRASPRHDLVPVDEHGVIDLTALRYILSRHPGALLSVMAANNETGAVTDMTAVSAIAREHGAVLHCDATQVVGRMPVDVGTWDVDLLSLSAHKFGGPVGTGMLFVSRFAGLEPPQVIRGGGQERGWRPGTVNVAGAVGTGTAAQEAQELMGTEQKDARDCRDEFESTLLERLPQAWVNAAGGDRLAGVSSVTLPGRPAEALMLAMPSVAVSEGSACSSGAPHPSHVLTAMGLRRHDAECTLRFSFGPANQSGDGLLAAQALVDAVRRVDTALAGASEDRVGAFA